MQVVIIVVHALFLSTLSLRRATCNLTQKRHPPHNFYPRSPCGERLVNTYHRIFGEGISIHALLAESDRVVLHIVGRAGKFLSTLSLRRATWWLRCWQLAARDISIHALLAESDKRLGIPGWLRVLISIHALLAESDAAGRSLLS